ncbi:MAG TPA: nodulation protein NfeD [Candidatus Krumholzibacteria bacterium]|nr:nodulation protein NfeD [Candidatus Krumholzibacteria bacterium]
MKTILLVGLVLVAAVPAGAQSIHVARWQDAITPVAAQFLVGAIERAEDADAEALIIELDTPGGLDTAMRRIIKAQLAATVPVVVYVSPAGSRAASAGVFITMAAHVAAMTPTTNIGSASPVQMMGAGMDSTMAKKVTNDAVAYLEGIAEDRDRNPEWAARFVEDSENITAEQALEENVIDLVVATRSELIRELDGREIVLPRGTVTLQTEGLEVVVFEPGLQHQLLGLIANPTVAYLLLLLGIYGIFFELSNPGAILPGTVGAIAILLALFALQALPVRAAGLALIALSIVLFVLEVYVTSFGLLGLAGVVAMVFGSAMLFEPGPEGMRLGWGVIIPAVAFSTGFMGLCAVLAIRGQRRPVETGLRAMVGEHGRVSTAITEGGRGKVVVHGEHWDARAAEPLEAGTEIEVEAIEGRTVVVRPVRAG